MNNYGQKWETGLLKDPKIKTRLFFYYYSNSILKLFFGKDVYNFIIYSRIMNYFFGKDEN